MILDWIKSFLGGNGQYTAQIGKGNTSNSSISIDESQNTTNTHITDSGNTNVNTLIGSIINFEKTHESSHSEIVVFKDDIEVDRKECLILGYPDEQCPCYSIDKNYQNCLRYLTKYIDKNIYNKKILNRKMHFRFSLIENGCTKVDRGFAGYVYPDFSIHQEDLD